MMLEANIMRKKRAVFEKNYSLGCSFIHFQLVLDGLDGFGMHGKLNGTKYETSSQLIHQSQMLS